MRLIEDLGLLVVGNKGFRKRFGIYECPNCGKHFKCATGDVKNNKSKQCRDCANKASALVKALKARDSFIEKAISIHGEYSYELINYVNNYIKIDIVCREHSIFSQRPNDHLNGRGCPRCAVYGFDKAKSAILYYLLVEHMGTTVYKIGVTNRTVKARYSNSDLEKITIIKVWDFLIGADAYNEEQRIMAYYKDFQYTGNPILANGNSELFTIDVLSLLQYDLQSY